MIRVVLVDDHPVVRSGLAGLLGGEIGIVVVGEADDGAAGVALATDLRPDLVLMDLRMPVMDGVETTRAILSGAWGPEGTPPHVVVLTTYDTDGDILRAVEAGATGYLLKDAFPTDIAATVRDLVAGHSPISASIARFIVRRTQNSVEPPPGPPLNTAKLTPREIDILWGIAKGFSYAEIAVHLGLSRQTVPGHIKSIYRKLEVHTRGEAVFEAVQQGLIKL